MPPPVSSQTIPHHLAKTFNNFQCVKIDGDEQVMEQPYTLYEVCALHEVKRIKNTDHRSVFNGYLS